MRAHAFVAIALAVAATACTSNPKVSVQRIDPARWGVEIVRCSIDGTDEGARADLEQVGVRRCRHGHDAEVQDVNRTWMGDAFRGECPAVRLRATVVCKGDAR